MGLPASKLMKQTENTADLQDCNIPSTPILSPKSIRITELDPRSPSLYISRTPLQLLAIAAEKLEKYQEICNGINETPNKHECLMLGTDPRSPTTDFDRTPIVLNTCNYNLPKKIYNKNLENVILSEIKMSESKTNKFTSSSKVIPPKLLESSPLQLRTDAYKRKSFIGLLETNIDFTETDIDLVYQEKCKVNSEIPVLRNKICVVKSGNVDPRSPTTDFIRTPIQIVKKIGEIELNNAEKIDSLPEEYEICRAQTVNNIEVDSSHEAEIQLIEGTCNRNIMAEGKKLCEASVENSEVYELANILPKDEELPECAMEAPTLLTENVKVSNCAKLFSESHPISLVLNEEKITTKQTTWAPVTPPLVNLMADIQELDKKLTNLIYEDEDIVVCPRIVKLKEYNERSPLRNRNVIEVERKKSGKLKVNDKPRKNELLVSKIPVFRDKNTRTLIQCENTPPRMIESNPRNKKACLWDNADKTLYL